MIYQLRVLIRDVSPLIWRCLLVRGDATLAELHLVLQAAFDWSDEFHHCFRVHGKEYGNSAICRRARLTDFHLHRGERFLYRYNFEAGWHCDIRLQAILPIEQGSVYPTCIGGKNAAPPEMCCGPWAYLERLDQHKFHLPLDAMSVIADSVKRVLGAGDLEVLSDEEELRVAVERLDEYTRFQPDHFERRRLNRQLLELAQTFEGGHA